MPYTKEEMAEVKDAFDKAYMERKHDEYETNHDEYTKYLLLCVRLKDWHGVSDAANDLRVLDAKWSVVEEKNCG